MPRTRERTDAERMRRVIEEAVQNTTVADESWIRTFSATLTAELLRAGFRRP